MASLKYFCYLWLIIAPITRAIPTPTENSNVELNVQQLQIPTGATETVTCTPTGNPLPQVNWRKHSGQFGKGTKRSGNSLIISDALKADSGYYACEGFVNGRRVATRYVKVEVTDAERAPPKVSVSQREIKITRGKSGTVDCTPSGQPLPTVQWSKEGTGFGAETRQEENVLIISNAQDSDAGNYVCTGVVEGTAIWTEYLQVTIEEPGRTPPKVSVSQRQIKITRGQSGSVDCTPSGQPLPTVQWSKAGSPFGAETRQDDNALIISNAQDSDAGNYVCTGVVEGTAIWTEYLQVTIEEPEITPPKVSVSQRQIKITRGQSGSVACTPSGQPLPTVRWSKAGSPFGAETRQEDNVLIISNAQDSDAGNYVCTGVVEGTAIWTEYLQVTIEETSRTPPKVSVSQRQIKITRGQSGTVDCTPSGQPLPAVQWSKAGSPFGAETRQEENTLIISNAQDSYAGNYVCTGVVEGTAIWTEYLQVTIEEAARTPPRVSVSQRQIKITKGQSGTVDCTPSGQPLPAVQWSKAGSPFGAETRQEENVLIISNAQESDAGNYVCTGVVEGTAIWTEYLQVTIEEAVRIPPKVSVSQRQIKITRGQSETVDCTPSVQPLPTVRWSKEGSGFGEGTRQNGNALLISNAQDSDGGIYVCTGFVEGRAVWTEYLRVTIEEASRTPPKVSVSQRQIKITKGQSGTVDCTPSGQPLPAVQWSKAGSPFGAETRQEENALIISNAQDSDAGNYVCTGVVEGTAIWTEYLQVTIEEAARSPPKVPVSQRQIKITRGQSRTVDCTPSVQPLPTVRWRKEGSGFGAGTRQNGNALLISNAQDSDGGIYVCTGFVEGRAVWTEYLRVTIEDARPPQPPQPAGSPRVTVTSKQVKVPRGGIANVMCVPRGYPLPAVQWTKERGAFREESKQVGNSLMISNAQESDGGNYVCTGTVEGTAVWTEYLQIEIEEPIIVLPKPLDVSITEGQDLSLSCDFNTGAGKQTVTWVRQDQQPLPRNVQRNDRELVIQRATKEDAISYLCKVTGDGFLLRQALFRLTMLSRPRIVKRLETQTVTAGQPLTIECVVEGDDVDISWDRVDGTFSSRAEDQGAKLFFRSIEAEDAGYYRCIARNQAGEATDMTQVIVRWGQPQSQGNPRVKVSARQLGVPRGQKATVDCIPEGYPLPSIQWTKEGDGFGAETRQEGNTLIISNAEDSDGGNYVCTGIVEGTAIWTEYLQVTIEAGGQPQSQGNPRVKVSARQLGVPRGQKATVDCIPEGYPLPSIQWTKEGDGFSEETRQEGNTLIISNAEDSDGGNYVCTGVVEGTAIWTEYLQVTIEAGGQPQSQGNPRVKVSARQLGVPRGQKATVDCIPEGYPLPSIQWTKEGDGFGAETRQEGNTLIISNAQDSDGGNYVCTGVVEGTAIWTEYLQVTIEDATTQAPAYLQQLAPRVKVSKQQVKIQRGQDGTVDCVPQGSPLPSIRWGKAGSQFGDGTKQEGNALLISNAQDSDGGDYVCTGVVEGTAIWTDYLRVEITEPPPPTPPSGTSSVRVSDRQLKVVRGANATVDCTPQGYPLPRVQWSKEIGQFKDGTRQEGDKLIISNAQDSDAGNYACTGVVEGTAIWTEYLQVTIEDATTQAPAYLQQLAPRVKVSKQQVKIQRGQDGTVDCVPQGSPLPSIRWGKAGSQFGDGTKQEGNALLISNAQDSDGGDYVCTGVVEGTAIWTDYLRVEITEPPPPTPPSGTSSVRVSDRQLKVVRGANATVDCTPQGYPLPRVQWSKEIGQFKDGTRQEGDKLIISNAQDSDAGNYACTGVVEGTAIWTEYLQVTIEDATTQAPANLEQLAPRVKVSKQQVKIQRGQDGTVDCVPQGSPLPSIRWGKAGSQFGDGTKQEGNALLISNAQDSDGGDYVCTGVVEGTAIWTDYLRVEITEPPPPTPPSGTSSVRVSDRQLKVVRGANATVDCTPQGYPLPRVQWSKEIGQFKDGTRQEGDKLIISNAQDSDAGNYACTGVVEGTAIWTEYLQVTIEEPPPPPPPSGTSSVRVSDRQLQVVRGANATVDCTPQGYPLPRVQWSKEIGQFKDGTRQEGDKLIISNAQDSDAGNYACTGVVEGTAVWTEYLQVTIEDICELPVTKGPCRARKPRWYYDNTQHKCRQFYYGGCAGNNNNFLTEETCQLACDQSFFNYVVDQP